MNSKIEYLREFSETFKSYVTLHKKYVELVNASELAFLEDFLEPCKELKYPSENLHEPHIRKAKRQFIECTNTISSLLSKLKQNFPKFIQRYNSQHSKYPSIFRRIRKLTSNIDYESIDKGVTPDDRTNLKECNELSEEFQKLVSDTSDPQEDKKPRKDPKPKKIEIRTPYRVMKYFGLPTAHFTTQPLKYLQQPMLTFPTLKLMWTVCLQKRLCTNIVYKEDHSLDAVITRNMDLRRLGLRIFYSYTMNWYTYVSCRTASFASAGLISNVLSEEIRS